MWIFFLVFWGHKFSVYSIWQWCYKLLNNILAILELIYMLISLLRLLPFPLTVGFICHLEWRFCCFLSFWIDRYFFMEINIPLPAKICLSSSPFSSYTFQKWCQVLKPSNRNTSVRASSREKFPMRFQFLYTWSIFGTLTIGSTNSACFPVNYNFPELSNNYTVLKVIWSCSLFVLNCILVVVTDCLTVSTYFSVLHLLSMTSIVKPCSQCPNWPK